MKLHITFEVNPGEIWEDYYLSNTYEVIEIFRSTVEVRKVGKLTTDIYPAEAFHKKFYKIG